MTDRWTGLFVRSKAGHDKGSIYIVIGETEDCLFLADGVRKTIASPKKKKRIHVQPVFHKKPETENNGELMTDLNIKRAIKLYIQRTKQEEKDV